MNSPNRRVAGKALLVALALMLVLPIQQVAALITVTQILTQNSTEFAAGKFGLTGLAQNGGVQLVPVGVLSRWQTQSGGGLCRPLGDMGTATFGPYIYTVGGSTSSSGNLSIIKEVCRTQVTNALGTTSGWTTVATENLPEQRTSLGAVAVPFPGDPTRGVLYAFGGRSAIPLPQHDTIYSAIINPDGSLQPWQTQTLTLPTPREKLTVTAYTNPEGRTFIYVIGGYEQPFIDTYAYPEVLRTEVGANGVLGAWVTGAAQGVGPVPIPPSAITGAGPCASKIGLYDADAVNFDVVTSNGDKRILAVLGGTFHLGSGDATPGQCSAGTADSAKTFLAEIAPDGNLTWQTGTDYTMLFPNTQLRAVGINQKIYAAGGLINTQPTNKVFSSYVNDQLSLQNFVSSNYLESETALNPNQRRAAHGFEYVVVNDTTQNPPVPRPIAFMFGGTSGDTQAPFRSDVLVSFIGLDDDITDQNASYANPGLYLSPAYQLRGPGNITEIRWNASIQNSATVNTDIKMEYRLGNTSAELANAAWNTVDGDPNSTHFSKADENIVVTSSPTPGQLIQYRAFLTTDQPRDRTATPVLRGPISIKYTIEGHPSLFVKSASFPTVSLGTTVQPDIIISNAKPPQSTRTESVLNADIESTGTFFVDLYVYPPDTAVVPPARDPETGAYPLSSAAFAEINKAFLPRNGEFLIPAQAWKQSCGATTVCPQANWQVIFNKPGTWKVIAIVDSGNNVTEAETLADEWENDNTLQFDVVSQVEGGLFYLPMIFNTLPPTP